MSRECSNPVSLAQNCRSPQGVNAQNLSWLLPDRVAKGRMHTNHLGAVEGLWQNAALGPVHGGGAGGRLAQPQLIVAARWRMAKSLYFSREARSPDFSVKSDF